MSKLSNDQGRALEYAILNVLKKEIAKVRTVQVEKNNSFASAKKAWGNIEHTLKLNFLQCAFATVSVVFDLEPVILEEDGDTLELKIQSDQTGKTGDVRDVLIIRSGINWEIGLSIKHNHFAVKHSRLGSKLDFGKEWFGVNCSNQYWNDVKPVFDNLIDEKKKGTLWKNMASKEKSVYLPLLSAFVAEIERCYKSKGSAVPTAMVEYLLGKYDFYKVIGVDKAKCTKVQAFNLRGNLNQKGIRKTATCLVPVVNLPHRIVKIGLKPNSNNTVELYLDEGWQFGFRIHNASSRVEPSLKFDVQIIGMPAAILTIDRYWS
jgi:hypothetical protein